MRVFTVAAAAVLALVVLAACGCGEQGGSGDQNAAEAVIAKIVQSMGGEKTLAGVTGLSAACAGTYHSGPMDSPYQATTHWMRSGALRWEMSSEGFDGEMGVAEGGTPWSAFMAPPARARGPLAKSMEEWLLQWDMFLVQPLLDRKDVRLSLQGDATIVVTLAGGVQFELGYATVGSKTFLTSMRGPMTHMDGAEGRMEVDWSEPKLFGEITLPAKAEVRTYAGDELRERMEETISGVAWNPQFPAGTFRVPAPGLDFDKPELRELAAMTGLVVLHEGPYDGMSETMGRAMAVAAEGGMMVTGGVIAVFLDDPATVEDPNKLRTEIVVPVVAMGPPPELPEGVALREFAAMTVASMNVKGEYGSVEAAAIPKVAAWMARHGHASGGAPRVVYYHEPKNTVPEDQVAEVQIPVGE